MQVIRQYWFIWMMFAICSLWQAPASAFPIGFHADVGTSIYYWDPALGNNSPVVLPLKYETEGLVQYRLSPGLTLNDELLFEYLIEKPLQDTPHQRQMLAVNAKEEYGAEEYTWILDFTGFGHFVKNRFLKTLMTLRYRNSKELYFGNLTVEAPALYYDFNGSELTLPTGSLIAFKSTFNDSQFDVIVSDKTLGKIRLGYFESEWNRPTQVYYSTTNKRLFAARYRVTGIALGLHCDCKKIVANLTYRFPVDSTITTSIGSDGSFKASMLGLGLAYAGGGKIWHWRLGADMDFRSWDSQSNTLTNSVEEDSLYRIFADISARF